MLRRRQHRRRLLRLAGRGRDDRPAHRHRRAASPLRWRPADVTQNDAERAANTVSLVAAIVLVAVLALAYYTGGYVAGRMSRFDGARQGLRSG